MAKTVAAAPSIMSGAYKVNVGSCGGFYFGDVVQGEDLASVFLNDEIVLRHLEQGSLIVFDPEPVVEVIAEEPKPEIVSN